VLYRFWLQCSRDLRQSWADRRSVRHRDPSFRAGADGFSQWQATTRGKTESSQRDYVGTGGRADRNQRRGGDVTTGHGTILPAENVTTLYENEMRKACLSPMAPLLQDRVLSTRATKQVYLQWVWAYGPFVINSTAAEETHTRRLPYECFPKNFLLANPLWPRKTNTDPHIRPRVNIRCPYERYPESKIISELIFW